MSMTLDDLREAYFEWMCHVISNEVETSKSTFSYGKLLRYLHSVDFTYTHPMDGNRAEDGIRLRYLFADDQGFTDYRPIAAALDDRPCSVLEMMLALAIRCEQTIMADDDLGDRTGQWFWNMILSLGLNRMSDNNFDEEYVEEVVDRFLNREYDRDGKGGLYTVEHCTKDMRKLEIWYQMCMYLDEIV